MKMDSREMIEKLEEIKRTLREAQRKTEDALTCAIVAVELEDELGKLHAQNRMGI